MRWEDLNVLIRVLVNAGLVAAFVLGTAGCATAPAERQPLVLFCTGGALQGVPGLVCTDPDTAERLMRKDGVTPQSGPDRDQKMMRKDQI